jgi:hypothetical protein
MRSRMLATVMLCLYPATSGAEPRVPSPDMRDMAWSDRNVTLASVRRPAIADIGPQAPAVDLRILPPNPLIVATFRYRAVDDGAPATALERATREMEGVVRRRPRVLNMRPLIAAIFDLEDIASPVRIAGAMPTMLGAPPGVQPSEIPSEEEWRRGWDSNPR